MNDAFSMRGVEGVGNLNGQRQKQVGLHRTIADAMLQCHAVEKLHDDEGMPILLPDIMNRADVWVIHCRSCFRLALEPAEGLRIFSYFVRQKT